MNMKKKVCNVKQMILIIGALSIAGCESEPPAMQENGYKVLKVQPENRTLTNLYSATVRGRQDIEIYPQVGGFLTELRVREGERVKQGQTLFIIDQVGYRAALQTAEANVAAAEAALATARLTYESKQELRKQNVISSFDLSTAKNALLSAEAQLAQMKAQEVNAQNNLSYTVVKSPVDGVIGTLPYRVGTLVGSAMPEPLTTVSDNSDMYVYFSMTENQLLRLVREYGSKEEALKHMPEIELLLNDKSIYPQKGKIESISGVINRSTGTVSLRAVFSNPDQLLHSGSTGNVVLPQVYDRCFVIPQAATFEIQDKVFVYKVIDGKAVSAPVQVTRVPGGKEYVISEGLNEGDRIVTEGVGLLREGTSIRVKQN